MSHASLPTPPTTRLEMLAALVQDRLILAILAGSAVWVSYLISLGIGGWRHDMTGRPVGADHIQYYVVGRLLNEGRAEKIYDEETMTEYQKETAARKDLSRNNRIAYVTIVLQQQPLAAAIESGYFLVIDEPWKGYLPFRYPPFYALCYAPTSHLPYEACWLVWSAGSFLALVLAGWLLGAPMGSWIGWSLCFFPVFAAFSYGQNSLLSLLILAIVFALWSIDRPALAGLAAGLLLFKPPILVGVVLLWLLDVRRSWRALVGMACMGVVLIAVSFLVLPSASDAYMASLRENAAMTNRHSLPKLYASQGFWMLLLPHFDRLTHPLSLLTSVAGLVVFVTFWWRIRDDKPLAFALAVLATPWLTPYAMVYDWSILLLPAALLWRERPADRPRWLLLFALIWLAALVSEPLVKGELLVSPIALQPSVPALWCTVWATGRILTKGSG